MTLTLAAIIPIFHQVEEVMEMKQKVIVEMIKSSASAGGNQSITQGGCRCAENSPAPSWEAKGSSSSLGSAQLKGATTQGTGGKI